MRHLPLLTLALMGAGLPTLGAAGSFATQIEICLEDSLTRSPEISGKILMEELEFCLSAPEALEGATIAEALPACREVGKVGQVAACLVANGLG